MKTSAPKEKERSFFCFRSCGFDAGLGIGFEEERNAPNAANPNECIDKSAQNRIAAAEYPGNEVELKNTDESPVKSADNHKRKRNSVNYGHFVHRNAPPFYVHNDIISAKKRNIQKSILHNAPLCVIIYNNDKC